MFTAKKAILFADTNASTNKSCYLSQKIDVLFANDINKAEAEYKKYQEKTLSEVEKVFLESVKGLEREIERNVSKKENLKEKK